MELSRKKVDIAMARKKMTVTNLAEAYGVRLFRANGLFRKSSHGTLTNAGEDTAVSVSRAAQDHDVYASHIQQSRYINHFRSRNRDAMTLLYQSAWCEKDRI